MSTSLHAHLKPDLNLHLNAGEKADSNGAQEIMVDEVFPHSPKTIWKTLITGTPAGRWDGVIHCQVLEVTLNERLAYSWKGGHEENVGYGAPLDTIVTWTLVSAAPEALAVHAGSLDDPGRFKPQAVTYRSKGHRRDHLDPDLASFETMPPM